MDVVIVLGRDKGVLEVFKGVVYVVYFGFLVFGGLVLEVVADVLDILANDTAEWGYGVGRHGSVVYRVFGIGCLSCKWKMTRQCKLLKGSPQ